MQMVAQGPDRHQQLKVSFIPRTEKEGRNRYQFGGDILRWEQTYSILTLLSRRTSGFVFWQHWGSFRWGKASWTVTVRPLVI